MPQPSDLHPADLAEAVKTTLQFLGVPIVAWFLGRRAQNAKIEIDTRSADQSAIKQLYERMDKLEGRVDTLMTEKFALEQKVVSLQTEIGKLEVLKAQYESRDATSNLQIKALEVRLAGKEEELRCAQEKLETLETKS